MSDQSLLQLHQTLLIIANLLSLLTMAAGAAITRARRNAGEDRGVIAFLCLFGGTGAYAITLVQGLMAAVLTSAR